jgi:hypothetical protein
VFLAFKQRMPKGDKAKKNSDRKGGGKEGPSKGSLANDSDIQAAIRAQTLSPDPDLVLVRLLRPSGGGSKTTRRYRATDGRSEFSANFMRSAVHEHGAKSLRHVTQPLALGCLKHVTGKETSVEIIGVFVDHLNRPTEDMALFSRLGLSPPARVDIEQQEEDIGVIFDDGIDEADIVAEDECEVNMDDL